MTEVKVLLTQNIQRAINKADRCANVIRNSERDEDENEEEIDEDKKYVLGRVEEALGQSRGCQEISS